MVESADVESAIPPAISQAPKQKEKSKPSKNGEDDSKVKEPKKQTKEKDQFDLTKIREKHAEEQAEQRCVTDRTIAAPSILTHVSQLLATKGDRENGG